MDQALDLLAVLPSKGSTTGSAGGSVSLDATRSRCRITLVAVDEYLAGCALFELLIFRQLFWNARHHLTGRVEVFGLRKPDSQFLRDEHDQTGRVVPRRVLASRTPCSDNNRFLVGALEGRIELGNVRDLHVATIATLRVPVDKLAEGKPPVFPQVGRDHVSKHDLMKPALPELKNLRKPDLQHDGVAIQPESPL